LGLRLDRFVLIVQAVVATLWFAAPAWAGGAGLYEIGTPGRGRGGGRPGGGGQ
jgi:hypothetical protein